MERVQEEMRDVEVKSFTLDNYLRPRWQTQGLRAESGPPPCFILPGTLFLPSGSAKLLAPTSGVVTLIQS